MDRSAKPLRLLRRRQIKERIPVSSTTIWRWERDGILPPPRIISGIPYQPEDVIDRLIAGERVGGAA